MDRFQKLNTGQILLLLTLIAILIRFPFFFRDYVDHDESTFILMGQAMIDGHLPYLKLWDLKPPLVFYFFAGIIAVFGKSFIAIRLIGSIIVGLTGWFVFRISHLYYDKMPSFYAGLITVYLLSLFGAMQGVMSEHLAALPLVMAMFYLLKNQTFSSYLFVGFLFGTAIMFRLNLAYAVFFVYAFVVFEKGLNLNGILKGLLLTLGSFLAFAFTFSPYFFTGNAEILKSAVFDASVAYSNAEFNQMMKTFPMNIGFLALCVISWKFLRSKIPSNKLMLLIVLIIGQAFMFFKSGKVNGHYLIQIFPFLAILVVALISKIPFGINWQKNLVKMLPILFLLLPIESYLELKTLFDSKVENGTYFNGEGNAIPAYLIKKFGTEKPKNIFFLNEHIGYWNLDTNPPTATTTHPSNLMRETAYPFVRGAKSNSMEELKFIMNEIQPNFIVYDERRIPMERKSLEFEFLQTTLDSFYIREMEFGENGRVKLFRAKQLQ